MQVLGYQEILPGGAAHPPLGAAERGVAGRGGATEGCPAGAQDEHPEAGADRAGHLSPHPEVQELHGGHDQQGGHTVQVWPAFLRGEGVLYAGAQTQL